MRINRPVEEHAQGCLTESIGHFEPHIKHLGHQSAPTYVLPTQLYLLLSSTAWLISFLPCTAVYSTFFAHCLYLRNRDRFSVYNLSLYPAQYLHLRLRVTANELTSSALAAGSETMEVTGKMDASWYMTRSDSGCSFGLFITVGLATFRVRSLVNRMLLPFGGAAPVHTRSYTLSVRWMVSRLTLPGANG